jgi:uncharacterized membrane protein
LAAAAYHRGMSTHLLATAIGAASFAVLDAVWLGLVMSGFYRDQLAAIGRIENGRFAPNWPAAVVVYLLLGAGLALFAVPRASSVGSAAGWGALLGLVIYGVYDFTNVATLKQYPLTLALVDVAWGAVAASLGAVAVHLTIR